MKRRAEHTPIHINWAVVQQVESFKFIVAHITKELSWFTHTNSREEATTMLHPPQEAEKIWHVPSYPQKNTRAASLRAF